VKIEKKVGIKGQSVSAVKAYAKLGFLYEFNNEISKSFSSFIKSHNLLCQVLMQARKEYDIWEIKAFADMIVFKLQGYLNTIQELNALFETHYSTFKYPIKLINDKEKYKVNNI